MLGSDGKVVDNWILRLNGINAQDAGAREFIPTQGFVRIPSQGPDADGCFNINNGGVAIVSGSLTYVTRFSQEVIAQVLKLGFKLGPVYVPHSNAGGAYLFSLHHRHYC